MTNMFNKTYVKKKKSVLFYFQVFSFFFSIHNVKFSKESKPNLNKVAVYKKLY